MNNTNNKLIDTHFHIIEMLNKGINIENELTIWRNNNNSYLIDIGVDEHHWDIRTKYSIRYNNLYHAVGIHPNSCTNDINSRIKTIEKQISNNKVIAVGETGLDYYWDRISKELQKSYFLEHINLAIKYNLPLIIHNREADNDLYNILNKYRGQITGIIHCFSSNIEYLEKFIDLDFYISYAGNVTFKKNTELQNTLNKVPLNKLLIETDSPYLTPVPKRGRLNTPNNVQFTFNFIKDYLSLDSYKFQNILEKNVQKLFRV